MANNFASNEPAATQKEVLETSQTVSENKSSNVLHTNINDSDGDGMPDEWESRYGLNPNDPTDAVGDPDLDGIINLVEFRQGTNPLKMNESKRSEEVAKAQMEEKKNSNIQIAAARPECTHQTKWDGHVEC